MANDRGIQSKTLGEELLDLGEKLECFVCGKVTEDLYEHEYTLLCMSCVINEFQKIWSGWDERRKKH